MSTSLLVAAADLGTVAEQVATFVGILKDHLRLGASNAKAVRTFVKLVTNLPYEAGFEDTRKDYPVDRYGDDYMRYIIEKPTGFKPDYADDVIEYLDTTALEGKVRSLPAAAKQKLVAALRSLDSNVGVGNVVEWVGDKVGELLAASSERSDAQDVVTEKISLARAEYARTEYAEMLLGEAQGRCPFTSCRKPLLAISSGKPVPDYEVIVIDPAGDGASPANLLACCHDCSVTYGSAPSADQVTRGQELKRNLEREHEISDIVAKRNVEQAIGEVIRQLPYVESTDLDRKIGKPLLVERKLPQPEHALLVRKILQNVGEFFRYIDTELKNNERVRPGGYDKFARTVADLFDDMDQAGASKGDIFTQLVTWLDERTGGGVEACEAVVSYFVQSCEVFR